MRANARAPLHKFFDEFHKNQNFDMIFKRKIFVIPLCDSLLEFDMYECISVNDSRLLKDIT